MIALVTGGASSGKSAYAELLACALPGSRYYLAAMKPFGEEGARRIARHRALRAGKGFATVECYDGLDALDGSSRNQADSPSEGETTALLESLGNVVANELFGDDGSCASYEDALLSVLDGVSHVMDLFDNLVIVGDEVGGDGLRYDESTETYIRLIGSVSCAIAAQCDLVVECVAGKPFVVKGESPLRSETHRRGQSPAMQNASKGTVPRDALLEGERA